MGWYEHIIIKHTSHYLSKYPRGIGCYSQQSLEFFMGVSRSFEHKQQFKGISKGHNMELKSIEDRNENFTKLFSEEQVIEVFDAEFCRKIFHMPEKSTFKPINFPKRVISSATIETLLTPSQKQAFGEKGKWVTGQKLNIPKPVEMKTGEEYKLVKLITIPYINLLGEEFQGDGKFIEFKESCEP